MMAQEFRYPLTRICLRSGTLTLPLRMLQVFPDDGETTVLDTLRGDEVVLHVEGRQVSGLDEYFAEHDLEVNDEIAVKILDDGGLGLTAVKRVRKPDYHRPEVIGRLIDEVVDAGVPLTEGEIRALHPDLPSGFPLRQALESESPPHAPPGSLAIEPGARGGAQSRERAAAERAQADASRRAEAAAEAERRADAAAKVAEQREAERRAEAAAKAAAEREAERDADRAAEPRAASGADRDDRPDAERFSHASLAQRAEEDTRAHARREREARADARAAERDADGGDASEGVSERFDWDEPVGRGFRFPWQRAKAKTDQERTRAERSREGPVPARSPR
jgi:hypothetical protein